MLREKGRCTGVARVPAGHFGKRASGNTFSTAAEGAGGFHSARKAAPAERGQDDNDDEPDGQLSHAAARMSPGRIVPAEIAWREPAPHRLTTRQHDMLVPVPDAGKKSGAAGEDRSGD